MSRQKISYAPVFELRRGDTVESIRFGAAAVVDASGNLLAWYGDHLAVTFMRSSAKPFQVMPFIEYGAKESYDLTEREIAILCSSHSGTDEHIKVLQALQDKTGVLQADLLCGSHYPLDKIASEVMLVEAQQPTSNHHNCSGMHTGVLKRSRILEASSKGSSPGLEYIDQDHPVQIEILKTLAEMSGLEVESICTGIDGCSLPSFALPLQNAALAYARLCDPDTGGVSPAKRRHACGKITRSMMAYPNMVAGPGRFDTHLMQTVPGRLVSKGGAEGVQAIGLLPGVLGPGSPGIGIFLKISDGDTNKLAGPAVAVEILIQLGVLSSSEIGELSKFGPTLPVYNWRNVEAGLAYPTFALNFAPDFKKKQKV